MILFNQWTHQILLINYSLYSDRQGEQIMRRTGAQRHTHKYFKFNDLWHCGLPNCTHYVPGNLPPDTMMGRKSLCWKCGTDIILDALSMIRDRPVCINCDPTQQTILDINEFINHKLSQSTNKNQIKSSDNQEELIIINEPTDE